MGQSPRLPPASERPQDQQHLYTFPHSNEFSLFVELTRKSLSPQRRPPGSARQPRDAAPDSLTTIQPETIYADKDSCDTGTTTEESTTQPARSPAEAALAQDPVCREDSNARFGGSFLPAAATGKSCDTSTTTFHADEYEGVHLPLEPTRAFDMAPEQPLRLPSGDANSTHSSDPKSRPRIWADREQLMLGHRLRGDFLCHDAGEPEPSETWPKFDNLAMHLRGDMPAVPPPVSPSQAVSRQDATQQASNETLLSTAFSDFNAVLSATTPVFTPPPPPVPTKSP